MRASVLLVAMGFARADKYVAFNEETYTNPPPVRALGPAVLQSTTQETTLMGNFVWMFGGMGGTDQSSITMNDVWRLDLHNKVWEEQSAGGTPPDARRGASLVQRQNRFAYLFGGETSATSNPMKADLWLLHLPSVSSSAPSWESLATNVSGTLPPGLTKHTATVAPLLSQTSSPEGMITFGGFNNDRREVNDMYELDFSTLAWRKLSPSGDIPQERKGHSACLILESLLVIFGGSNHLGRAPNAQPIAFSDVRIYDIARNYWFTGIPTSTTNVPVGRDGHSMLVIDETVYIFGGVTQQGDRLNDLWTFNTYAAASRQIRWQQPTAMSAVPQPRWGHAMVGSRSSMILIGGATLDAFRNDVWHMTTGCSGSLTLVGSRGVFSDGEGKYRAGQNCEWVISPTTANANVMLVITELELLDSNDKIEVYDGATVDPSTLVALYTGSTIPPTISSSGSHMLVRLRTDTAGTTGAGFSAAYQAICKAGYTWDDVSSECRPCPAGSYSELPASSVCKACPIGFYGPTSGASSCMQCPSYATTTSVGSYLLQACQCQPGYYGWDNQCKVCPEGAVCPGGNLVSARAGWCATSNSTIAVPSFAHCCQPEQCPGGINARCDATVGLVGGSSCAVQVISWDTLNLVSLTNGTWATFLLILLLALLICFCTGLSIGVRRAVRRQIDSLVVPVPRAVGSPPRSPIRPSSASTRDDVEVIKPPSADNGRKTLRSPEGAQTSDTGGRPLSTSNVRLVDTPRGRASVGAPSGANNAFQALLAGRQSAFEGGEMTGASAPEEDVMVVSLDDPTLGANAPPPMYGAMLSPAPASVEQTPRAASESVEADEEAGDAAEEEEEEEESPKSKKKGKKGKKAADDEEEEEEEGQDKKGKKGKDKKGKKGKKGDDEGEGDDDGGDKKKKKKKKKGE